MSVLDLGKRLLSLAFFAVFTLGTLVQFNDPDPEVWVPYWSMAAALPFLALVNATTTQGLPQYLDRLGRLYLVVASLYWVFRYLPGVVQDYKAKDGDLVRMVLAKDGDIRMKDPAMEQAREFGGVVIILLYVLFIYPFSYPSSAAAGKGKTA